jgi:hypothetical protein
MALFVADTGFCDGEGGIDKPRRGIRPAADRLPPGNGGRRRGTWEVIDVGAFDESFGVSFIATDELERVCFDIFKYGCLQELYLSMQHVDLSGKSGYRWPT